MRKILLFLILIILFYGFLYSTADTYIKSLTYQQAVDIDKADPVHYRLKVGTKLKGLQDLTVRNYEEDTMSARLNLSDSLYVDYIFGVDGDTVNLPGGLKIGTGSTYFDGNNGNFSGTVTATNFVGSGFSIGATTTSGSTTITGFLRVDTPTFRVDPINNRVGINQPGSIASALEVVGTSTLDTVIAVGSLTFDSPTLRLDPLNNRVGIGKAGALSTALDISGTVTATGAILTNIEVSGSPIIDGTLTVDTISSKTDTNNISENLYVWQHCTVDSNLTVGDTVTATGFEGNGSNLTNVLNSNIEDTISARLNCSDTVYASGFSGAGGSITGINASNISSGTLRGNLVSDSFITNNAEDTISGQFNIVGNLTVTGTSDLTDTFIIRDASKQYFPNINADAYQIYNSGDTKIYQVYLNGDGSPYISIKNGTGTTQIFLSTYANNYFIRPVGIGNNSPGDSLEVSGGILADTLTITDTIYANTFQGNGGELNNILNSDREDTTTSRLNVSDTVYASGFSGAGGSLTGLNASNISSGTLRGNLVSDSFVRNYEEDTISGQFNVVGTVIATGLAINGTSNIDTTILVGALTVDSPTLRVDPANNRVGIGQAGSISSAFEVVGISTLDTMVVVGSITTTGTATISGAITTSDSVTASGFEGNGGNLTNVLNSDKEDTISARLNCSDTVYALGFSGAGGSITGINASNIATGTLAGNLVSDSFLINSASDTINGTLTSTGLIVNGNSNIDTIVIVGSLTTTGTAAISGRTTVGTLTSGAITGSGTLAITGVSTFTKYAISAGSDTTFDTTATILYTNGIIKIGASVTGGCTLSSTPSIDTSTTIPDGSILVIMATGANKVGLIDSDTAGLRLGAHRQLTQNDVLTLFYNSTVRMWYEMNFMDN